MATYNGVRWLGEQIDSIIAQSDEDWQLLISDDGSSDGTLMIVHEYLKLDSRIRLLPPRGGERGTVANFEYLLYAALKEADGSSDAWVVLCDQDDVWIAGKLLAQRQQLQTFAACCSDPLLSNADGAPTGGRLLAQLNADRQPQLSALLAQNSVVGCTLAVTLPVLETALPFPQGLRNHDWWLALCALAYGSLFCDSQAWVHYRQHDANVVGAYKPKVQMQHLPRLFTRQKAVLCSQLVAVETLLDRLTDRGSPHPGPSVPFPPPRTALERYSQEIGSHSFWRRLRALAFGEFAAPHLPLRALRVATSLTRFR
ncbi:MAG: glycosyltransferase [Congregibacter sp.]|nr:glycosyltransferase [Congregibacter sp.]